VLGYCGGIDLIHAVPLCGLQTKTIGSKKKALLVAVLSNFYSSGKSEISNNYSVFDTYVQVEVSFEEMNAFSTLN